MENNVEAAEELYASIADSFAALDPLAPAHRRNTYAQVLYNHGLRYGGTGLARAAEMFQAASEAVKPQDPVNWASTTQNLAIALVAQARRTEGEAGTALLKRAVTAYEDALTVTTKAEHPRDWAMTQENLAILHLSWAARADCQDAAAHLQSALTHVTSALEVYDPEHSSFYFEKATRLKAQIEAELAQRAGG